MIEDNKRHRKKNKKQLKQRRKKQRKEKMDAILSPCDTQEGPRPVTAVDLNPEPFAELVIG